MLLYEIPGRDNIEIENIVFDYNGTIAIDGKILTFPKENAGRIKEKIVEELGGERTICVGNGYNDIHMFEEAVISIAVIEGEGVSGKLLSKAAIVVRSIIEGINILLNKNMIKATLRN